ncbi:hypothetical protein [Streptomyces sp. N35]|uniref:hypothetical protein n=1 Tax=Streptomyces sp. N35 TaxID=2795730 RepID=UPI0018F53E97|nr:hypothetical protein [Streptomyces sp. N35]
MTSTTATPTCEHYLDHLRSQREVSGITLCGSTRMGVADDLSDLDIWVFCPRTTPLSEAYALDRLLPEGAVQERLFEGRDESLVDHFVLNLPVAGRWPILNLKFLRTDAIDRFAKLPPTLDPDYLENLENYLAMEIQHDPDRVLRSAQEALQHTFTTTNRERLTLAILQRYASLFWRSVYQGVLRDEAECWHHLIEEMIKLLTWSAFLCTGHAPPPAKWLYSPKVLGPQAEQILRLRKQTRTANTEDPERRDVLRVYLELAQAELDFLPDGPWGTWWRHVFGARIANLLAHPNVRNLQTLADRVDEIRIAPEAIA